MVPWDAASTPSAPVEGIDDALRRLDVAGRDRGRRARIEQGVFRDYDLKGLKAPLVQRNGCADERAEHVQHRRRDTARGALKLCVRPALRCR